jgi:hypothetical protein
MKKMIPLGSLLDADTAWLVITTFFDNPRHPQPLSGWMQTNWIGMILNRIALFISRWHCRIIKQTTKDIAQFLCIGIVF